MIVSRGRVAGWRLCTDLIGYVAPTDIWRFVKFVSVMSQFINPINDVPVVTEAPGEQMACFICLIYSLRTQ